MALQEFKEGTDIITAGTPINAIYIIKTGNVRVTYPGGSFVLNPMDVLGVCDISSEKYIFSYSADTDVSLLVFPIKDMSSVSSLCKSNPDITRLLFTSTINQVKAVLQKYQSLKEILNLAHQNAIDYYEYYADVTVKNGIVTRSLEQFDCFTDFLIENDLPGWMLDYYNSCASFSPEINNALPQYYLFVVGFIFRGSDDITDVLSLIDRLSRLTEEKMSVFIQENCIDMFDLYTGLLFRLPAGSDDFNALSDKINELIEFIKFTPGIDTDLVHERVSAYLTRRQGLSFATSPTSDDANDESKERSSRNEEVILANSLDSILDYSGVDDDVRNRFKKSIGLYKKMADRNGSDDASRKLRQEITSLFYEVYSAAVKQAIIDEVVPTIIKMFLNFGYVDEELAGAENTAYLSNIADSFNGDEELGVYTALEWLRAIYLGKKDPGRNEFDTDYFAFLHEEKIQGNITEDEEKRLSADCDKRLQFEIDNMFRSVNKVTFGRISTFCPVFSDHNVLKPLPSSLVTPDNINECLKKIKEVDYSAFYHETIYTNEKAGISKEYISININPNIILMPNIGVRGVMWQEIEGRKRTTPARFAISAFHLEDLPITTVRLVGEYRWEMCKRIQGSRWNDVTDRSLTSEYFDYVQFYKKNNELSQETKEKIRQSLIKCKNSFKEMFVRDYATWVLFEGTGSPRLNKLVRTMMLTYCPFPKSLRVQMASNPLFTEIIERYEIKTKQKLHHMENVITKLNSSGISVPSELLKQVKFIDGEIEAK